VVAVNKFMMSIHFIFFISAIIMIVSVIPSLTKWNSVKNLR
jgi:hypothetical protein